MSGARSAIETHRANSARRRHCLRSMQRDSALRSLFGPWNPHPLQRSKRIRARFRVAMPHQIGAPDIKQASVYSIDAAFAVRPRPAWPTLPGGEVFSLASSPCPPLATAPPHRHEPEQEPPRLYGMDVFCRKASLALAIFPRSNRAVARIWSGQQNRIVRRMASLQGHDGPIGNIRPQPTGQTFP